MPCVLVTPFVADAIPERVRERAAPDVLDRWTSADRSTRSPELVSVVEGEALLGAALVSARAGTAYLKIVDAVGDAARVVDAVVEIARARGLVQVKWEGWSVDRETAAALGFTALRQPRESARETGEPPTGFVRWLAEADTVAAEPAYYRQTESFTCGAVVSLMAHALIAAEDEHPFDREAELAFWRTATNFPACEPVGLGAAVQRARPDSRIRIALDTDRAVMIGHLPESEQQWRAVLQRSARADAVAAGAELESRRVPIAEIRSAVEAGEQVLLVLSLERMQGFTVPHWVLCHAAVPGALVVEDPWTSPATGDTWVDAHLLPVADAALDEMAALEEDGYRGVVRIG